MNSPPLEGQNEEEVKGAIDPQIKNPNENIAALKPWGNLDDKSMYIEGSEDQSQFTIDDLDALSSDKLE